MWRRLKLLKEKEKEMMVKEKENNLGKEKVSYGNDKEIKVKGTTEVLIWRKKRKVHM